MSALCALPGGLGRFLPCNIGANHCRLRHVGWEKCGHGLTSRPKETSSAHFLSERPVLFGYPPKSGRALLERTLPLTCRAARFARKVPLGDFLLLGMLLAWLLNVEKKLALCMLLLVLMLPAVLWLWVVVLVWESLDCLGASPTQQKNPASRVFQGVLRDQPRHRVWKRLRVGDFFTWSK